MYNFLKQDTHVEEEFSKEQKFRLKELHEEVDMFMEQFRAKHQKDILVEDIKGSIPPKRLSMVKQRTVWSMNEAKVEYYKREMMKYESRVLQITHGIPVLSVSNKLLNVITGASYFMIKKSVGSQSRKISLARLVKRKEQIDELFQKTLLSPDKMVEYLQELDLIKKVIDCTLRNKKDSATLRIPVNDVRFFAYDQNKRIVTVPEGEHFKGGILIGKEAKEVEVFSPFRKERVSKIREDEKIYIDKYSYFVCKGQQRD